MPERKHYHVTCDITNTCTLGCYACRRQTYKHLGIPRGGWKGQNMPLEDLEKLCDAFREIGLCGQVSDPIFHPQFPEILKIIKDSGKKCFVHTAATSPKLTLDWYEKCFEMNPNAKWIIGMDGLPINSFMHREGQDSDFLWEVLKRAPNAIWQWIVFNYNEDDIARGKEMADKHGIRLQLNYTNRFFGNPKSMDYEPTDMSFMMPSKEYTVPDVVPESFDWGRRDYDLIPKCLYKNQSFAYVNTGFLLPCCYVDGHEYEDEITILTQDHLKLENNASVFDITMGKEWGEYYDTLLQDPTCAPTECWKHCSGKHDVEKYGTDSRRKRVFV